MRYIKLSEKILDWEWFTDGNMVKIWLYLLINAQQFEDTRYMGIELKTGQLVTGRKQIAKETGLSEMQVRTCLNKLKSTNEITIETTNKYSVITILKYGLYQSNEIYGNQENNQQINQQVTNKQPTDNQQITTSKRDKREREKDKYIYYGEYNNVKLTLEQMEKLQAEFPDDYLDRIERVSEYCASHGTKYKDYLATIRNWARKEKPKVETLKSSYEEMANAWKNY